MESEKSSSSEEENIEMLREICDEQFLTDSLYKTGKLEPTKKQQSVIDNKINNDLNDLKVTPEFQAFVAKRLGQMLDSQIKEKKFSIATEKKCNSDSGVFLLSSSSTYLSCNEEPDTVCVKRKKKKINKNDDGISSKDKVKEAAVSPEWILSQQAIAGWEPNKKGKVIVLKSSEVEIKGLTEEEKKQKATMKRKRRKERLEQEREAGKTE